MASDLISGFYLAQIAILDDNNYPMGTLLTPNSPVNGTVYSPYIIPSVVEYRAPTPTYVEATSYAAMKQRGRRSHGVSDFGIGQLIVSEDDDIFDALVMEYLVDTTLASGLRITARNAQRVQTRRFTLWLTGGATDVNSTPNFKTFALANVYFNKQGMTLGQGGGQNPNNITYDIVQNVSARSPLGQLYSASALGVDGNADTEIGIRAAAPVTFATYVDDGAGTSVVLPYAPLSTEHAGVTNIFTKNGVTNHAGVGGISSATLTVTAGTAADKWVIATPSLAPL
jgi:hypothetical protein